MRAKSILRPLAFWLIPPTLTPYQGRGQHFNYYVEFFNKYFKVQCVSNNRFIHFHSGNDFFRKYVI